MKKILYTPLVIMFSVVAAPFVILGAWIIALIGAWEMRGMSMEEMENYDS